MANHLPSRFYFGFGWATIFVRKKSTASGNAINGGSREEALGGAEFQRGAQILKINRIPLAYDITSNKDQTFVNKSCFVFLLYRGIYYWFCAIYGRFGGIVTFGPFKYTPEGHGSPPWVNTYKCIPIEFEDDICTYYFQEVHANYPCIGILYHRFKQNVPESESRQFDRHRLRLRLLARCHDSGRHRLRLRLRLRTPATYLTE